MNRENKINVLLNFLYFGLIFGLVFLFFKYLFFYLFPLIFAAFVAVLIQKPSIFLTQKIKLPKRIVSLFLVIFFSIVLILGIGLFLYLAFKSIDSFKNTLINYGNEIVDGVLEWRTRVEIFLEKNFQISVDFDKMFGNTFSGFTTTLISYATSLIVKIFSSMPQLVFNSIIFFVAACYISYDYDKLRHFVLNIISSKTKNTAKKIKEIVNNSMFSILKGYSILMVITFVLLLLGFLIIKIRFGFVLSLVIAIIDIFPILGTGTVLIPWAVISLLLGKNLLGIELLILYAVITIVRNIIEPHIIGKKIGVSPLFILIAMFIGLRLFGFLGLLSAPVVLITVYEYYRPEKNTPVISNEEEKA